MILGDIYLTVVLVFIGIQIASIPLIIAAYIQVDGDLEKFQKGAESSFMDIGMNSSLFLFLNDFYFYDWPLNACFYV